MVCKSRKLRFGEKHLCMNSNQLYFVHCLFFVKDWSPRTSSKVGWGDGCGGRVWSADRQLRSWYRAKGAEHNKGAQHTSQYTHYTVKVALLDMRCTVKLRKKLTVVRYGFWDGQACHWLVPPELIKSGDWSRQTYQLVKHIRFFKVNITLQIQGLNEQI